MAIFYPTAYTDDGCVIVGQIFFNNDPLACSFGCTSASYPDTEAFFRFPNINIPPGSIITSAYVRFTAYASRTETPVNLNVVFNDVDDAVAPPDLAAYEAIAVTSAIAWNNVPAWTDGVQYNTPELKTILQDVVGRAGWAENNAVMVCIENNGTTYHKARRFSTFEHRGGAEKAELHITWTGSENRTGDIATSNPSLSAFLRPPPFMAATMSSFNTTGAATQNVIYANSSVSLPLLEASLEGTEGVGIACRLPTLTAAIHTLNLGSIASEVPLFTADITASVSAQVEASLPALVTSMLGGARNEVEIPFLTTEMAGVVGGVGSVDVRVPYLATEMIGKVEYLGNSDVTLPVIIAHCHGNIGRMADIAESIPSLEVGLIGVAGVGDVELRASIPSVEAIAFLKSENRFDSCEGWKYKSFGNTGDIESSNACLTAEVTGTN